MNGIYFDNAATSFPKPPGVAEAVAEYISDIGANINRSSYAKAYDAESMVFETRQLLCDMFNGGDLKNAVFTKNITESLNVILKGLLKPGDHVITSSMEHNAVMRPLVQLEKAGVSFSRVPCTSQGKLILPELEKALRDNTRAVVMTHASNVCGTVMPVKEVGEFCREHGLIFILDSAQTAGVLPIDMEQMNIDALCFTGHKGLLGPQGIGGFILKEHVISRLDHAYINDIIAQPSAENIAVWIWRELDKYLVRENCRLYEVHVWETETSCVTVRRSDIA